jgi:aminoglycoside phosphotransferase (APT) family kinase protein
VKGPRFDLKELEAYLEKRSGAAVHIEDVRQLGSQVTGTEALKQFGYGRPFLVAFRVKAQKEKLVFHRIRRNAFGRERQDDRVAAVWLDFRTFNRLPHHVPAVDMVIHTQEGKVCSIQGADEALLVTAYRPGEPYARDLMRIQRDGLARPLDFKRTEALASYLAEIHQVTHEDPMLWRRRLRDLVGHGEGIMGLTDSYPEKAGYVTGQELRSIEEMANRWRWRLKGQSHRLSQVHGDFHPFNILFERQLEFHLLDRSRGEWGEPGDDVSCFTINYLFFSLQRSGRFEGPFRELHDRFWERYLAIRPDQRLSAVIQPWFAWRALVLASPVWYPDIPENLRQKILGFARRILESRHYDYSRVDAYLEDTP